MSKSTFPTLEILVNRQKYVLMCIDIIKMPSEIVDDTLKEYAESELLRMIGEQ